jgi:isopentenyl diphosphate isomerase/L-lactate dehydrogenase-like FMN-dependent dehydrogenase
MEIHSIPELMMTAERSCSEEVWGHIIGGAGTEMTVRRNRLGLDSLALRPRVLRDVSSIDMSTTVLGHRLRIPVMLAPIGSLGLILEDATSQAIRAAISFGTMGFVSSVAAPGFAEISAAAPGEKFFQLYIRGDSSDVGRTIDAVKAAGYSGIAVTVDSAYYGVRDRQLLQKWQPPAHARPGREHQARVTWETVREIMARAAPLPVMLKGIQTAEDARMAVELGVAAIYISNHGGRQLDQCQATIDILPEVAEAVAGRAEIIVDGGVMRGTDVVKAIALGARAVSVGRLYAAALACGGEAGVIRMLELLEGEIANVMGLMGMTNMGELGPASVTPARPA